MTFINIPACAIGLGVESCWAGTVADTTGDGDTLSALRAVSLVLAAGEDAVAFDQAVGSLTSTVGAIALLALLERVPVVARGALTVIAAGQVLTEGVETTHRLGRGGQGALVDISTHSTLTAETTLANTLSLGAELALRTRITGGFTLNSLYVTNTGLVRITRLSLGTFTAVVSLCVFTEGSTAARVSEALVDVDTARFTLTGRLEALVAHAARLAVQQRTLRVGSTEDVGTRT